jgi:hypothetical protein
VFGRRSQQFLLGQFSQAALRSYPAFCRPAERSDLAAFFAAGFLPSIGSSITVRLRTTRRENEAATHHSPGKNSSLIEATERLLCASSGHSDFS